MTDSPDAVGQRLAQTPALLKDAARGRSASELGRRQGPRDWAGRLAGHDDNHLDQLRRAVDGRP